MRWCIRQWTLFYLACFFLQFRDRLAKRHSELFGGEGEGDLSAVSNFNRKWGWYNALHILSNGDVTKIEQVSNLNVGICLLALEYNKEITEAQQSKYRK